MLPPRDTIRGRWVSRADITCLLCGALMALTATSQPVTCDVWTELPPLSSFFDLAEDGLTKPIDQRVYNFAHILGIEPDDPYCLPSICEIDDSVVLAMISALNNDKFLAYCVGYAVALPAKDKISSVATPLSELSDDIPSELRSATPKTKKRSAHVQQLRHGRDEGSVAKRMKDYSAEEKRALGFCTVRCCGNAPVPGGKRCQPHRDQCNRKKREERDEKRKRRHGSCKRT